MGSLSDTVDLYVDLETLRSAKPPQPWWKDYPPELPFYELWLEDGGDRPRVRDASEIKTGNRKPEKAAEYIADQIAKDEAAAAAWDKGARDRYHELQAERDAAVEALWETSTLDAFLGGQVGCIGLGIGEEGPLKSITPDNDPLRPEPKPLDEVVGKGAERIMYELWLSRMREYRLLKRLAQGMQTAATRGMPEGQQRHVRLVTWGGYRLDFPFLALRSAFLARVPKHDGEPADLEGALTEEGLDRDLVYLCAKAWPQRAEWKQRDLVDLRATWAMNEGHRWVRGTLPNVARFFGYPFTDTEEAMLELDHGEIPRMLRGSPEERARAYEVNLLDVRLLRHVHGAFMDRGIGT